MKIYVYLQYEICCIGPPPLRELLESLLTVGLSSNFRGGGGWLASRATSKNFQTGPYIGLQSHNIKNGISLGGSQVFSEIAKTYDLKQSTVDNGGASRERSVALDVTIGC